MPVADDGRKSSSASQAKRGGWEAKTGESALWCRHRRRNFPDLTDLVLCRSFGGPTLPITAVRVGPHQTFYVLPTFKRVHVFVVFFFFVSLCMDCLFVLFCGYVALTVYTVSFFLVYTVA